MTLTLPPNPNAEAIAYWASRPFKVWCVDVTPTSCMLHKRRPWIMYVRSSTKAGAEKCARRNCYVKVGKPLTFAARLATPHDLGAVRTPATTLEQ